VPCLRQRPGSNHSAGTDLFVALLLTSIKDGRFIRMPRIGRIERIVPRGAMAPLGGPGCFLELPLGLAPNGALIPR
jgi:hypothetical protein